jgi:type IV pilus assembly protein PilC
LRDSAYSSSGRLRALIEASKVRRPPGRPSAVLLSNPAPLTGAAPSDLSSQKTIVPLPKPSGASAQSGPASKSVRPSRPNEVSPRKLRGPTEPHAKLETFGKAIPKAKIEIQNQLRKPSLQARVIFWRSLSTMVKAGIPLERALNYLAKQSEDVDMAQICLNLADFVREGNYLSSALSRVPQAFSQLQIKMVAMGEQTGVMDSVLCDLSEFEERQRNLLMRVKGSLTYPACILVLALLMVVFVPPMMMNGLFKLIANSGMEPPLITRLVMGFSSMVQSPIFFIPVLGLTAAIAYKFPIWLKEPDSRRTIFENFERVRPLRTCLRVLAATRFARSLSVQIAAGADILPALQVSAEISSHPGLEDTISGCKSALTNGRSLSMSLATTKFFPKLFVQMVAVGEECGAVSDLLARTADLYEQALDSALDSLTSLVEPFVIGGMGIIVGIFVLATMMPIGQLLQTL